MLSDRICLMPKMVRFTREEEADPKQNNFQKGSIEVLRKLMGEEATLMEEKKNLASLREKLLSKIQEEIYNKKNNIQKLKSEIKDLKISCEELTKSFKTHQK
jgi:seryl-tRNA synthetase